MNATQTPATAEVVNPTPEATQTLEVVFPTSEANFEEISQSDLVAFLDAPDGPQNSPYVILSAFQPLPSNEKIELRGMLDRFREFRCPGSRCEIPVWQNSVIAFRAYSSSGAASPAVNATIRVSMNEEGYIIRLDSVEPVRLFHDSCAEVWGMEGATPRDWMIFPQTSNSLATRISLHYLSAALINAGVVDASACPGNGFSAEGLNACGLEVASNAALEWQNMYDFNIWLAARDHGIPPKILKTLIEVESQFWPANARNYQDEYGLAQISELGTDVILRWDKDFYDRACPNVIGDCSNRYLRLPAELKAMMRGFVVRSLNVECADCPYGMDLTKAQKSIHTIARILRSNCVDAKLIIDTYNYPANYEDLWKYTLATYHSGFSCVEEEIKTSLAVNPTKDWQNASYQIRCPGSRDYVENYWTNLLNFDSMRLPLGQDKTGLAAPEFMATPTPQPTPTVFVSTAALNVQVYLDANDNGHPDEGEWLDGIPVRVLLENGIELNGKTSDGKAYFDLRGYPVGIRVTVDLPGIYRSTSFQLPSHGTIPVLFSFDQPVFPTAMP